MVDLGNEHSRRRLSHRAERRQKLNFFCMRKASALVSECFLSVGENFFDLLPDKVVVAQHAFNIASEEWRQWPTIACPYCVEAFPQALPDAFAGEPNPVQRQKPFDTPNDADARFDEVLSLTLDAPQ